MARATKTHGADVVTGGRAPVGPAPGPVIDFGKVRSLIQKKNAGMVVSAGVDMAPKNVIPTGLPLLDLAWNGGLPLGRITHLWGDSSTGKTMLGLHFAAQFHRWNPSGIVLYFDVECALSSPFAAKMGIDMSRLITFEQGTVETAFAATESAILEVRKMYGADAPIFVVWDSLAAMVPEAEAESGYDAAQPARLAAAISKGIKKLRPVVWANDAALVILNQCRTDIGVRFGSKDKPCGGKAAVYNSDISTRIRLAKKLKVSPDADPYGIVVELFVDKTRLGFPYRRAALEFHFATGLVTDRPATLDALKRYGLARAAGGKTKLWDGSEYAGVKAFVDALDADPRLVEVIMEKLATAYQPAPGAYIEASAESFNLEALAEAEGQDED